MTVRKVLQSDNFAGVALALTAFVVYLSTLSTTIQYEDCGELAAAVSTLGITHPTGYPLLSLVAWVAAHLPFDTRVIVKLNVMVALFCSLAVFFFHRLFLLLLSSKIRIAFGNPKNSDDGKEPDPVSNKIAAAAGALVLAFSATFWSQAVSFEVYAFHLLFLSINLILFLQTLLDSSLAQGIPRSWYLFAFVLGLSFANHMMTILLAPAFLYLYFATHGFRGKAWIKIAAAAIPFLGGLSLYLYLPLRASQHPVMNWGNPETLGAFWRHITGAQYQHAMYSSFDVVIKQSQFFLNAYPSEFGYVPLLFALPGAWILFRRMRKLFVFTALLFLGCLFYALNYNTPEPAPYLLLAYVATAMGILFGIRAILSLSNKGVVKAGVMILCATLFLWPLCVNYETVDDSHDFAVEDYARNMLNSLEPGAIIITDQGEYFSVAAYYLQLIEGVRTDVVVLDKSLLVSPWYYQQLEQRYPWLVQNSRSDIDAYVGQVTKAFDDQDASSSTAIVAVMWFDSVIQGIIKANYPARPVYITADVKAFIPDGFHFAPSGLAFRVFREAAPAMSPVEFSFRPIPKGTAENLQIQNWYATGYLNQGIYSAINGKDTAMAVTLLRKALEVKSDFMPALSWLQRLRPVQ